MKGIGEKLVEWQKSKYPSRSDYDEWDQTHGKYKGKPGYENYESERKRYMKLRGAAVLSYRKYRRDEATDLLKIFQGGAKRFGLPPLVMDPSWGTIKTPRSGYAVPEDDKDVRLFIKEGPWTKEVAPMLKELFIETFSTTVNSVICYLNDKLEGEWDCGGVCTNV